MNSAALPARLPLPGVRLGLLAAAFLFCCSPALTDLARSWSGQDRYGFTFLVPLMTAAWVWHDRSVLGSLPVRPSPRASSCLFALAGAMLFFGRLGASSAVQELALVVVLAALVLQLLGTAFLKRLALPLGYLALMVPLLDPVIDRLHWPFQLFAAAAAGDLLTALGVPVHRSAQYLELPRVTLEVAEACSGVRYLVSTLVLSVPLLFITQRTRTQRLLLLLLALVIAVVANPVRVTVIGLWAYYAGGEVHGPGHLFQGYAVYLMGMGVLFAGAWLIRTDPRLSRQGTPPASSLAAVDQGGLRELHPFNQAWFLSVSTLLGIGLLLQLYTTRPVPLKKALESLPSVIGGWRVTGSGQREPDLPSVQRSRSYGNASGREITVTIAYLEVQDQDRKLVVPALHRPLPVGGTVLLHAGTGSPIGVNRLVTPGPDSEELRLFWYRVNGRTIASRFRVKWTNAVDGALLRRNNGGLIVLSCNAGPGEREQALRDLKDFAEELLPRLTEYIP